MSPFLRASAWLVAAAVVGCGGDVDAEPTGSGAGAAGASGSGGGAGSSSSASSGAGPASGGAGGGGDSEWTVWPGQAWAAAPCDEEDGLKDLLVELWPYAVEACLPPSDIAVDNLSLLGINDWDGAPGNYAFGESTPHGRAGGAVGLEMEVEGWLTIEPYAQTPAWIEWEIDGVYGRTDLSVCADWNHFACSAR